MQTNRKIQHAFDLHLEDLVPKLVKENKNFPAKFQASNYAKHALSSLPSGFRIVSFLPAAMQHGFANPLLYCKRGPNGQIKKQTPTRKGPGSFPNIHGPQGG